MNAFSLTRIERQCVSVPSQCAEGVQIGEITGAEKSTTVVVCQEQGGRRNSGEHCLPRQYTK